MFKAWDIFFKNQTLIYTFPKHHFRLALCLLVFMTWFVYFSIKLWVLPGTGVIVLRSCDHLFHTEVYTYAVITFFTFVNKFAIINFPLYFSIKDRVGNLFLEELLFLEILLLSQLGLSQIIIFFKRLV